MAERSIVTRLKADISDLRSKFADAGRVVQQNARTAEQAAKLTTAAEKAAARQRRQSSDEGRQANEQLSRSDKLRARVRQEAADAEVRSSERLKLSQQEYGRLTGAILENRDSIQRVSAASGAAGLALAAGVGVAVKSYADFDQQMSNVAATGADARANLNALRETAIEAGADTAFSAGEAAAGIENLLKAGVDAEDVMAGGLAGSLNLAAAGGLGVAEAAEVAATAMTQFRLSGEQVPHIADLLAAGAGKAQGEVSDMAAALKQSGLVASQFGLTVEDTVGTLSAFASAGLVGSDAGTSFRTMLLSLAKPAKETQETMDRLGISAYDAEGNFVGVTNLAQQLQDRLGGLTQAQRDAAMAQIFGSDAIRAANVLYQQGADGIQDWIDQTNDAGYAQEVAATKTDNLYGDIERLTGSLDSLLIRTGGGNDVLRGLVQQAEAGVDAFGALDPAVSQTALAVGAAGSAALLAFSGMSRLAVSAAETKQAMVDLETSSPRAASGLRAVRGAATGFAAALGTVAVLGAIQGAMDNIPDSATQAEVALEKLADGDPVDLEKWFNAKSFLVDIKGLDDAISTLVNTTDMKKWGSATAESLGFSDRLAVIRRQFAALDEQLVKMNQQESGAAFKQISERLYAAKVPVQDIIALFPRLEEKARAAAKAANFDVEANGGPRALIGIMQGEIPAAMRTALESTTEGRKALQELEQSAEEAADGVSALTAAMQEQASLMLEAADAQIAFEAAIDDVSEAITKTGRAKDNDTAAGRANNSELKELASRTLAYAETLAAQEGKQAEANATMTRGTREFLKNAEAAGYTRAEAVTLAASWGLIPKTVSTDVAAPGSKATKAQVDEVNTALNNIDPQYHAAIISAWMSGGYDSAMGAIRSVPKNTTTTITVRRLTIYETRGKAPAVGGPRAFAVDEGRAFGGPIGGTSPNIRADDKLIAATSGEFMQDVLSTRYLGEDAMWRILSRQYDPGAVRSALGLRADGYAFGGLIRGYAGGGRIDMGKINQLAYGAQPDSLTQVASAAADLARALSASRDAATVAAREQRDLSAATAALSRVQKLHDDRVRAATRAAEADAASREGLAKKQRREATALDDQIDAARKRVDADDKAADAQVAKIRQQQKLADRRLDDQLDAARKNAGRDFGKSPAAQAMERRADREVDRLEEKRKQRSRRFEDRIDAAQTPDKREAANIAKLAALQAKRDRLDKAQRQAMERADARTERSAAARQRAEDAREKAVDASSRKQDQAQRAYDRAADRAKDRTDRLKEAQEQLAQSQQRVSDTARQAADGFASQYRAGGDLSDLLDNMTTGAKELADFNSKIGQLERAGLNQTLVQKFLGDGVAGAGDIVDQILASGQSAITDLNRRNSALVSASQSLGMTQAREAYGIGKITPLPKGAVGRSAQTAAGATTRTTVNHNTFPQQDPHAAWIAFQQRGSML